VVERDRLLAGLGAAFVDDVEHLEERHVATDARRLDRLETASVVRTGLAPDLEVEVEDRRHPYL
jgi:hypothetical protein